ncbi:MAG: NADH:ubiquinone reductase (Na(+)-transporting) subunit B [Tidjanibacter sp.]|nr:NADH:ubiquinone reductase (Na(+)-transporting) subunit B [Tidjanibacter sp.]
MKQNNNKPLPKRLLDKFAPTFSEGGKLSWLHSFYEAMETFFYVPTDVTKKGAHVRDCNDMKRTMFMVIIALVPTILFGMWNIGFQRIDGADYTIWQNFWWGFWQMLPSILVTYVVGLSIECAFAQIRKEEVNEGFFVSGILIPLIIPIGTPLWMTALATAFAVVIGKEIFGGTGMNIFNPALLARLFIFFSYTSSISGEAVWFADARTGATPLGELANTGTTSVSMLDAFIGTIPGSVGETSTLCILLGAIVLLATGTASWRTMLSVFVGGIVMGGIFNLIAPAVPTTPTEHYMALPAWQHLLLGGFAFGAVFMATDPVTSAQTNTGKYIVGFMIGALAVLVRVFNTGYPEGMMLAIIFMNALAPVVDHYVVQANIGRRNRRAKRAAKTINA